MNPRIKFCGLTRLEDALEAARLGVDALGFVLVPGTPRLMQPAQAEQIRLALPPALPVVALFQNPSADQVRDALAVFRPSWLQFHGTESAAFCAQFGLPYVKTLHLASPTDWSAGEGAYPTAQALLADAGGGSGKTFDWTLLPAKRSKPLFLAGGLTPLNAAEAAARIRPDWLDVSSGIEGAVKGLKDSSKMADFVKAVRGRDP